MQYSVPSHNSNCVSDAAATLHRSIRNTFRAQIAIHKLVLLLALAFLPLLAWHQSTGYLFEKISMPPGWEEMFKELQDLKQNTGLWVALWILVCRIIVVSMRREWQGAAVLEAKVKRRLRLTYCMLYGVWDGIKSRCIRGLEIQGLASAAREAMKIRRGL
jgi:hypothetical protein